MCLLVILTLGQSRTPRTAGTAYKKPVEPQAVIVGPSDNLQAALRHNRMIYLKAGDYHVDTLEIPAQRRVIAYPGAKVHCKGDLKIGPGAYVQGLTVHNGRIIIYDDSRLTDCVSIAASRERTDLSESQRDGFMILGNDVILERCIAKRASYAGINVRGSAIISGCRVYGASLKGLSVNRGTKGTPIKYLFIRDFYCDSADIGIQLDTKTVQIQQAHISNIHIEMSSTGIAPVKIATCDQVTIDNLYAGTKSKYGLILAEGIDNMILKDSFIQEGITQFPDPTRPGRSVKRLTLRDVTLGPSNRPFIWDHVKVGRLLLDNVEFPKNSHIRITQLDHVVSRDITGLTNAPQPTDMNKKESQ